MSRLCHSFALVFLVIGTVQAKTEISPEPKVLTATQLKERVNSSGCTFVSLWATWCSICLRELPILIPQMKDLSADTLLIDLSDPYVQQNFSIKWIKSLAPSFPVYLKPSGPTEEYLNPMKVKWKNSLPAKYLFKDGKLVRSFIGGHDTSQIMRFVQRKCKKNKKS